LRRKRRAAWLSSRHLAAVSGWLFRALPSRRSYVMQPERDPVHALRQTPAYNPATSLQEHRRIWARGSHWSAEAPAPSGG
jgi:hypothetical protein